MVYVGGVRLEQDYIEAYRLLQEVVEIKKMPDTLQRAIAIQQWGDKATALVSKTNQPYSAPVLSLVQAAPRQPQQNCDDVSHLA